VAGAAVVSAAEAGVAAGVASAAVPEDLEASVAAPVVEAAPAVRGRTRRNS
jgi:hypothetical protein